MAGKLTKSKRTDTRLQSEGAEFLVIGQLLVRQVEAYKSYTRFPGYDLIAIKNGRTMKIQVKSAWKRNRRRFLIRNFDSDFVVYVQLNEGEEIKFWVFPTRFVKRHVTSTNGKWTKLDVTKSPAIEAYKDRWDLITGDINDVSV